MSYYEKLLLYFGCGLVIIPIMGIIANGLPTTREYIIMFISHTIIGLLIVFCVLFVHYRGFDMDDIKSFINKFRKK